MLAAVATLVACGGDDSEPQRARAELATLDDLRELAADEEAPVFWAGPRAGVTYELSQTSDGRIYIRYLPPDAEIGDPRADYLTVGTYPAEDALAATRRTGEREGGVIRELDGGGIAVYNESSPTSVYLAFPGVGRQVEVYHPSAEAARELAYSGAIEPIVADEAAPERSGQPVAATEEELRELVAASDHPVYWLGPRSGVAYELTRFPNGQVTIRYLPEGVDVGDDGRHVTVGSYPTPSALEVIRAASPADAKTFPVPGGGLAYVAPATPTSVHFAFPGEDFQVEVFDPSPGRAERLVRAGRAVPIR